MGVAPGAPAASSALRLRFSDLAALSPSLSDFLLRFLGAKSAVEAMLAGLRTQETDGAGVQRRR